MTFQVRCSECGEPMCWFVDGDPYLPFLICNECHDKSEEEE